MAGIFLRGSPSISFQMIPSERFAFVRWRVDIEVELLFPVRKVAAIQKRKFSEEILILNKSFPENYKPILQTPIGVREIRRLAEWKEAGVRWMGLDTCYLQLNAER